MTAPVFESADQNDVTDVNSLTITKPTGTASGDLLIAFLDFWDDANDISSGVVTSSGWTVTEYETPNQVAKDCVAWKIAGGSEPADYTFSFTIGGSPPSPALDGINGGILRISGADQTTPLAAVVGAVGGATAPNPPSSGTVPLNDYLCIAACHDSNIDNTPPASFTERVDAGIEFTCIATLELNGVTSADPGPFGVASSNFWSAYTVMVQPPLTVTETPPSRSLSSLSSLRSL